MKKLRFQFVVFILFLMGMAWSTGFSSSKAIYWYDYENGIAKAKSEQKKIFLNFYADWCTYCKKMQNETFRNASVVSYLNENFISIIVDSEKERKITADFNVRELPTNWFLSEDGEKINRLPGFVAAQDLLPLLKFIDSDSYKKMSYRQFRKTMN
jgi:thioredoxin-related protein